MPTVPTIDLNGRAALVTGGAVRIGRALALALAASGAGVVVHHRRSVTEARELVAAIADAGGRAATVDGDLGDPTTASGLPGRAAAALGGPMDILINNASIFAQGSPETTDVEAWDANHAVNLRAPFLLSRAFAAQLAPDGPADIINLNDHRALRPGADHFAYTISKVGLHGLTRSLALALAPRIRVNELALGAVLPPVGTPEEYIHTLRGDIPTRRFGSPDEVADAMLFLLGNAGVTGQTLFVDGGRHLA